MPTFLSRARGYSLDAGELHFRDHHRRRRHCGFARRWMAGRFSAAAHEELVLFCFRCQHGARCSGDDRRSVCQGPCHGSSHRAGSFSFTLQHFSAERRGDQFGRRHIRATAIAVNIFIIHLLGDVPSPTMMGYVADQHSLQAAFILPVIAMIVSSAILFYGMRFAPPMQLATASAGGDPKTGKS